MAITESWLKANNRKKRIKAITKTDRNGLVVRVTPKGKITHSLRYYYNNKQTRTDLGTYSLLSIKEARTEMLRLRKKLEQGHNPKIVRQLEKQTIIAAKSLKGLPELWYDAYCVKNKKMHHDIKRSFEIHVFPRIGALPAEKITFHEWLDILEKLADEIVCYEPAYMKCHRKIYGCAMFHIEVRSLCPERAPLPITESGYRSIFITER